MDHTTNATEGIPLDVVQHTLWHMGDRAYGKQPGRFIARLMVLILSADTENRSKLASIYPDEVRALLAAVGSSEGFMQLRDVAKAAQR